MSARSARLCALCKCARSAVRSGSAPELSAQLHKGASTHPQRTTKNRPESASMVDVSIARDSGLYSSPSLRIRGTAPAPLNPFLSCDYYDVDDELAGSYVVAAPSRKRWNGEPAIAVTDIFDRDGILFMRIVRRPFRVWSTRGRSTAGRGHYVITDPDNSEVGVLVPHARLDLIRLRVDLDIEGFGHGRLKEAAIRHERGARIFRVFADPDVALATIRAPGAEITVEHEPETPAAWRCTVLALATCLPQFGVGSVLDVGGGP